MPSYNVFNARGSLVTTIGVATTTGAAFPIELIGQGIALYGPIIAQNQYFILENFAKDTPPTNPVEGMFWYNSDPKKPNGSATSDFKGSISKTRSAGAL